MNEYLQAVGIVLLTVFAAFCWFISIAGFNAWAKKPRFTNFERVVWAVMILLAVLSTAALCVVLA